MNTLMIAGFILFPFVLSGLSLLYKPLQRLLHFIALFCIYLAGITILLAVYQTNANGTTFTTQVHHILLDPLLVIPGAFLGIYVPFLIITYLLLPKRIKEK
ncbi:hypothetical protein [Paenibacillus sp. Marseille-Q4541]|uniref:hypothetical protein n=1 Tax=Paenibacillus sp. Marseille-Q4541 TaxID=2831522 RepID=UPI001BAA40FA|nr:hypothetical protein [Paenibacillus sp. Marseille-Q4541]